MSDVASPAADPTTSPEPSPCELALARVWRATEGIFLVRAPGTESGFKGVTPKLAGKRVLGFDATLSSTEFAALQFAGMSTAEETRDALSSRHIGTFATPEEAALACAFLLRRHTRTLPPPPHDPHPAPPRRTQTR